MVQPESPLPARVVRVIGPGRAGGSLLGALAASGRWRAVEPLRRDDPVRDAAHGVDLLVIATPDRAIADVAARIEPVGTPVVAHLSGACGLDVLGRHPRRGAPARASRYAGSSKPAMVCAISKKSWPNHASSRGSARLKVMMSSSVWTFMSLWALRR